MVRLEQKYGPIPWRRVTADNRTMARAELFSLLDEGVDTLVLAQGSESEDGLLAELEGYGGLVRLIGDCLAPRTAEEAVLDGLREAWRL